MTIAARLDRHFSWLFITIFLIGVWWVPFGPTDNFVMGGETQAGGYAIVAGEYPTLSPELKTRIAHTYAKGYLTRRDVSEIISKIVEEKPGGVVVNPAPNFGDPEGDSNSWMWRRIVGERASYKSKAKLESLIKG